MGDLNSLQASDTVKIAGANTSGNETNFVNASSNGDMQTSDVLNTASTDGIISLTTSAVPMRIGLSNLADRKYLILEAKTVNVVWGFSAGSQPFDIFKDQLLMIPCGPNITVYAKTSVGTGQIAVGELS